MATKINVCDVPNNFKLHTGSDANILSLNMLELIQPMPEVRKSYITMHAYNGGCIPSIGESKVTLSYKNNIIESTMQIIKQCRHPILGARDCDNLNIVKRVNAVVTDSVANVRHKYPDFGGGMAVCQGQYESVKGWSNGGGANNSVWQYSLNLYTNRATVYLEKTKQICDNI